MERSDLTRFRRRTHLAVFSLVPEGGGDAVLDRFDPGLPELLRVCLQNAAPVGDTQASQNCCLLHMLRAGGWG